MGMGCDVIRILVLPARELDESQHCFELECS